MPDLAPDNTVPNHHLPQILIRTPGGRLVNVAPTLREPFLEEHSDTRLIRFAKVDEPAEAGTYQRSQGPALRSRHRSVRSARPAGV